MVARRIIFLAEDRYSKFNHNRFGIGTLEKQGFSVEFWDCTKILRPQFHDAQRVSKIYGFSGVRYFEEMNGLLAEINGLTSRDTLITFLDLSIKTWSVLRRISYTKVIWGTCRQGMFPIPPGESNFYSRFQKLIRRPSIVISFLLQKLPLKRLELRTFDFILKGGTTPLLGTMARLEGSLTKILDVPSFDYDRHLQAVSDSEEVAAPGSVVFLDDGGPFHRDQFFFKNPFPCTMEEYFSNLNSFFNLVEKKFNYSVVVASHPRVDYNKEGNPFNGRRIVEGETHKLVEHSKFVFSTCSTSVNFAVMYKKPIVFLSINPTKRNPYDPMIKSISASLGKLPVQWADKDKIDWDRELMVNQDCYNQYINTYIKKQGSTEKLSWEILADHIKSIAV
jgi:hypothetical protein